MSEEVGLPRLIGYNDDYYDGGKSLHESELNPCSHIGIRERQLREALAKIAALTKQLEGIGVEQYLSMKVRAEEAETELSELRYRANTRYRVDVFYITSGWSKGDAHKSLVVCEDIAQGMDRVGFTKIRIVEVTTRERILEEKGEG